MICKRMTIKMIKKIAFLASASVFCLFLQSCVMDDGVTNNSHLPASETNDINYQQGAAAVKPAAAPTTTDTSKTGMKDTTATKAPAKGAAANKKAAKKGK